MTLRLGRKLKTIGALLAAACALTLSQPTTASAAVTGADIQNLTIGFFSSYSETPANIGYPQPCNGGYPALGTQAIARATNRLAYDSSSIPMNCDGVMRSDGAEKVDQAWDLMPAPRVLATVRTSPNSSYGRLFDTYKLVAGWERNTPTRCLDAMGSSTSAPAGTKVGIYTCDPNEVDQLNQRWIMWDTGVGNNSIYLINAASVANNGVINDAPRLSLLNSSPGVYTPVDKAGITLQNSSPSYSQGFFFNNLGTHRQWMYKFNGSPLT